MLLCFTWAQILWQYVGKRVDNVAEIFVHNILWNKYLVNICSKRALIWMAQLTLGRILLSNLIVFRYFKCLGYMGICPTGTIVHAKFKKNLTVKSLIYVAPIPKTLMSLVLSCSCLCPSYWCYVLSWEWRCSWSSADRWCSNYIWVINNFISC